MFRVVQNRLACNKMKVRKRRLDGGANFLALKSVRLGKSLPRGVADSLSLG